MDARNNPAAALPEAIAEVATAEDSYEYGTIYTDGTDAAVPLASMVSVVEDVSFADDDETPLRHAEVVMPGGAAPAATQDPSQDSRPELICASACKPTEDFPVGIALNRGAFDDEVLRIIGIENGSLFSDSPIRVGDELIRINGVDCDRLSTREVRRLLRKLPCVVTIVVKNSRRAANPCLAWTHIVKPFPDAPVGVSMLSHHGQVCVAKLTRGKLARHTLMRVGDLVLSINNTALCNTATSPTTKHISAELALHIVRSAPTSVLIVTARTPPEARPAFISATIVKTRWDKSALGLGLEHKKGGPILVTTLAPFSRSWRSPIMVGDKVLSINNKNYSQKNESNDNSNNDASSMDMLEQLTGPVTVKVQVDGGNPSLIGAMVSKLWKEQDVGLTLGVDATDGSMRISQIATNGLFSNSLLSGDDKLVSINGHECSGRAAITLQQAESIIQQSTTISIIARTEMRLGVVVAAETGRAEGVQGQTMSRPSRFRAFI